MGKYKIKYFRDKCIGAASCALAAPDTWEMDAEDKAVLKKSEFDDDTKDINIEAAQSCPTQAIEVYDDKGTKIV